jgi:type III secretion system YscQ/HrcQ family protein
VHAGRAIRVLAAGPARALERDLTATGGALLEASLTVLVNDDAYAARLLVPRAAAFAAPAPTWTRASLAALGDVPIPLAIVAAATRSTAAEIGSLCRGDAWVPGAWPLHRTSAGTLAGPVLLAAAPHEIGIRAVLGDDGRLVVREGTEPLAWAPASRDEENGENEMSDTERKADALVDAVGEVPVVVRVEIGVAEMRAREWASLAPGDVVALGRKIGESVTLRVGGVAVARGELVDLGGEVGVRILGRPSGESGKKES